MHRLLILLFLLGIGIFSFGSGQHATVCKLEVNPSKISNGAACIEVTGTICFQQSVDDLKKAGDSLEYIYTLEIQLKEGGHPVTANAGYDKHYSDETGLISLVKRIKLSESNIYNYDFSFTVPLAALNLPEGKHNITLAMSITDDYDAHSIIHKTKIPPVVITIPPSVKIRISVKHILVDSLDADGSLWDYFILSPVESNPDIAWSLNYAGQTYFTSKTARNVFEYSDPQSREKFNLTISKDDILSIEVKDIDDLTPDDIIGTVLISSTQFTGQNELTFTSKAGQIKSIEYIITVLP